MCFGTNNLMLNDVIEHIKGKNLFEKTMSLMGRKHILLKKDSLSFGLFTSPPHTMGDTRHGPHGPMLDMQKFDGTDP